MKKKFYFNLLITILTLLTGLVLFYLAAYHHAEINFLLDYSELTDTDCYNIDRAYTLRNLCGLCGTGYIFISLIIGLKTGVIASKVNKTIK